MEQELERLRREAVGITNTTAHFMGLAEAYLEQGNTELARACLILLCNARSNYEESLEWNGLTEAWQRHKHLVEGLVPPSVRFASLQPLAPQACSMQISEILALPEEDLLSALSEHLGELSANGEALHCLNQWERTAYYADELCMEVNSGGFEGYLSYHGAHFDKAYKAMETIAAHGILSILDTVRDSFPRKRIPKTEEALQNALEILEERCIDFDQSDEAFYSTGVRELLSRLLAFVLENKQKFR